jgi:DedD protein
MTSIQQQRLVGLGLLLLLISVVAFFLISSANENHQAEVEQEEKQNEDFASLVEPLDGEQVKVVPAHQEALVDPHQLADVTPKHPANEEKVKLQEPEIEKVVTESKQVVKPAEKTFVPSERWTAQLASFSQKANADALAEKVKSKGYDVELLTGKSGSKTIYRVRLQSEANKVSIEQKAEALRKSLKLNPQVFKVSN